jgi:hypothetical protein
MAKRRYAGCAATSGRAGRAGEGEAEQGEHQALVLLVHGFAAPEAVADAGRLLVEADEPAPVPVLDPGHRLDPRLDVHQMREPDLDDARQALAAARVRADVERHRERVRAAPVGPGVGVVEDVEFGRGLLAQHRDKRRVWRAALMRLDHLRIGEQHRAVVEGDALRAEEQFRGAQHVRVLATVERVAQDEVDELVEKQGRNRRALAHQPQIGGLDGRGPRAAGRGSRA